MVDMGAFARPPAIMAMGDNDGLIEEAISLFKTCSMAFKELNTRDMSFL